MNVLRAIRAGMLMSISAGADADAGGGGNGGAAGNAAFLASLPEPLRGNDAFKDVGDVATLAQRYVERSAFKVPDNYAAADPSLKDFKSIDDVWGNLVNARKMVGMDKGRIVALPKDEKDNDGWNAVYKTLGRPDAADKYVIGKKVDGTDYSDTDKAFQQALLPALHKANLTQPQLDALRPAWDEIQTGMAKAHDDKLKAQMKETGDKLRSEWGGDFDTKVKLADNAISHLSAELKLGDALTKELNAGTLGNNPALAKLFAHLGAQYTQDGVLGKGSGPSGTMGKDAARAQIAAYQRDEKFMSDWTNKSALGHADAMAKMTALYEAAYPPETA